MALIDALLVRAISENIEGVGEGREMIVEKRIDGLDVEIKMMRTKDGCIDWEAIIGPHHICSGMTGDESYVELMEALPEIVEMIAFDLEFNDLVRTQVGEKADFVHCPVCGREIKANTDCLHCLRINIQVADDVARARDWEREFLANA